MERRGPCRGKSLNQIAMTLETVIKDIERHCNNYFNPGNNPADPTRNHPPEFLVLAKSILKYREDNKPHPVTSESVIGVHKQTWATSTSGAPAGWQQIFSGELTDYKRVRFI